MSGRNWRKKEIFAEKGNPPLCKQERVPWQTTQTTQEALMCCLGIAILYTTIFRGVKTMVPRKLLSPIARIYAFYAFSVVRIYNNKTIYSFFVHIYTITNNKKRVRPGMDCGLGWANSFLYWSIVSDTARIIPHLFPFFHSFLHHAPICTEFPLIAPNLAQQRKTLWYLARVSFLNPKKPRTTWKTVQKTHSCTDSCTPPAFCLPPYTSHLTPDTPALPVENGTQKLPFSPSPLVLPPS